jgi:hypothetical protein
MSRGAGGHGIGVESKGRAMRRRFRIGVARGAPTFCRTVRLNEAGCSGRPQAVDRATVGLETRAVG